MKFEFNEKSAVLHQVFNNYCSFCLSMRPNIFLGISEGSAQYRKWYYELMVDHLEPFVTAESTHLRVGWASTEGYSPYPGGGAEWGGNGVGDDLYSYGFDGLHLWSGILLIFFVCFSFFLNTRTLFAIPVNLFSTAAKWIRYFSWH